jgi:hypothetical protein
MVDGCQAALRKERVEVFFRNRLNDRPRAFAKPFAPAAPRLSAEGSPAAADTLTLTPARTLRPTNLRCVTNLPPISRTRIAAIAAGERRRARNWRTARNEKQSAHRHSNRSAHPEQTQAHPLSQGECERRASESVPNSKHRVSGIRPDSANNHHARTALAWVLLTTLHPRRASRFRIQRRRL